MNAFQPAYLETFRSGHLEEIIQQAVAMLSDCQLCPRRCKVNRREEQLGICQTGAQAQVSSYDTHFGEEAPLVGRHGSGTIFFTHCNLLCNFCQNFDISHEGFGHQVSQTALAEMMVALQDAGCHNINFVTPTHVVPQILTALPLAIQQGLHVPLVYNTSGYDRVSSLKLLEGVVDIYMPDFKFWDPQVAKATCNAADYPKVTRRALLEMHRQVGDLVVDERGIAQRGLLVRHLVLPAGLAGTEPIMRFIAQQVSPRTYVNVMKQYHPCGEAHNIQELARPLNDREYQEAVQCAKAQGLQRLDKPRRVFMLY